MVHTGLQRTTSFPPPPSWPGFPSWENQRSCFLEKLLEIVEAYQILAILLLFVVVVWTSHSCSRKALLWERGEVGEPTLCGGWSEPSCLLLPGGH